MPIDISFDTRLGISILRCHSVVTLEDCENAYTIASTSELFIGTDMLLDFGDAQVRLSESDVRRMASKPPNFRRMALLAPDELAYGLSRMFEMLSEDKCQVGVFAHRDEALRWLQRAKRARG